EADLWLGRIVDQDHVYVNGKFVGTTGYQYPPRKYKINDKILKTGENTITVRVINENGQGGFIKDKPYFLAAGKDTIDLKGIWRYKPGTGMEPLGGPTFVRWKPGGLYNRMISPAVNYKIKGIVWYQGESNTNDADLYSKTFPALIKNWREKWGSVDLPFIYMQLPNFMAPTDEPTESNWAALRQAQLNTLTVSNTAMVVAIDLGEWNDVHPLNKQEPGKRLAQQAFKLAYGEKEIPVSPIPVNQNFGKKKVEIWFENAEEGLTSKNGEPLKYFELSADGKIFYKASASIKKNRVIVWNKQINHPVAVRYAWADNPESANLCSRDGLPASPFELRNGF
ncbi:MAG: sialate O-acetylesterase, partial [Bacteroidales bacterium]|nr:sialate O-acetylesterase [Bacteroidales bacterium]